MSDKLINNGNILLVANWESNVGYAWWLMENFWAAIAEHFDDKSCFLIYPKITKLPKRISTTCIQTSELNFSDHSIGNLIKIAGFIKSNSIRYIYLSDSPSYSWFYIFLRFFGIKKIVIHDHTPGDQTAPARWKKTIKNLVQAIPYYTADHFIAVTDFVHQRHLNVTCLPEKKCSVVANGITPFKLDDAIPGYAQDQFDIPEDRLIVITTGRASYYKGIDFFIQCADELLNKQKLIQLHFLFCGDGPELNEFKRLCSQLDLSSHFSFAGKRTDVDKILPSCHIGFHAAHGEVGYSLSILEYMSAGLATIVPDRPSTSNATEHLKTGLVYQHDNLQSACDAIKKCLSDDFRKQLADNAIKKIEDCYNISNTNKALINTLNHVFC